MAAALNERPLKEEGKEPKTCILGRLSLGAENSFLLLQIISLCLQEQGLKRQGRLVVGHGIQWPCEGRGDSR